MKKPAKATTPGPIRGLDSEYRFDYAKSKANRFADRPRAPQVVVVLAPDVAVDSKDGEPVNALPRARSTD